MVTDFERYSDILLDAYQSNARSADLAQKKLEILEELFGYYDTTVESVLFMGFSPGLLGIKNVDISVTEISDQVKQYLDQQGIVYKYIAPQDLSGKKFSVVVAVDEYLTFADSDLVQRDRVNLLCELANEFVVTTLRDYKNQDYKDREFSQPIAVRNLAEKKIYFEHYEYDNIDRNACLGTSYCVDDDSITVIGPFARRNMFFKQLAKFSLDAGARNFLVHKNLMHKSVIKKNYEHIITIRF